MDQILVDLAKCRNVKFKGIWRDPFGEFAPMPLFVLEETEEERNHHAEKNEQGPQDGPF